MSDNGFTGDLRDANASTWEAAVTHRFVEELGAGTVPDVVMGRYLVQDHRFLDAFVGLLGAAVTTADTLVARLAFGRYLGVVCGGENDYFLRAFDALGISEDVRSATPDAPPTSGFIALMQEAADSRDYASALTVLLVAEWLYLDWAVRCPSRRPSSFVHAEWIEIHDEPSLGPIVSLLRAELDRVGLESPNVTTLFTRAVDLELAFFEAAYEGAEDGTVR
ncbi:TenA family protein [Demetria terragena]|uniref:TenA family protein n=1 Tax=Demetria terragena TaxID=63959 RepID=UPI000372DCBF|nr:TenA family protein [Demetria terragena]